MVRNLHVHFFWLVWKQQQWQRQQQPQELWERKTKTGPMKRKRQCVAVIWVCCKNYGVQRTFNLTYNQILFDVHRRSPIKRAHMTCTRRRLSTCYPSYMHAYIHIIEYLSLFNFTRTCYYHFFFVHVLCPVGWEKSTEKTFWCLSFEKN